MSLNIYSRFKALKFLRINISLRQENCYIIYRKCSTDSLRKSKLEDYFFDKNVQGILKKITGLNYDKVFRVKQTTIEPDKFEFATEDQLKEMRAAAYSKAMTKLQMPPVMDEREPINEVLSKDPELQFYLDSKLVFTDISPSMTTRTRVITVRELDGTLRKATWEERDRLNQTFFPIEGKEFETPQLFETPHLEKVLGEESYEFVLDRACVQFEPDDPEYHRVTSTAYEHIKRQKKFDVLRSTRHFGPMAFYFATKKDVDALLVDMLERQLIGDAADTIRLLHILNPDLGTIDKEVDDTEFVKDYVHKNKSSKTADLELALQTFLELQQNARAENVSS